MEKRRLHTAGDSIHRHCIKTAIKPPIAYAEKLPTSENVKIPLVSTDIESGRAEFRKIETDKNSRWIMRIAYEGEKEIHIINLGELICEKVYRYNEVSQTMGSKEINHLKGAAGYCFSPKEAKEEGEKRREIYLQAKKGSEFLLDEAENTLKNMPFEVDYFMSGDTYGIDEAYLYIKINHLGYAFTRKIS